MRGPVQWAHGPPIIGTAQDYTLGGGNSDSGGGCGGPCVFASVLAASAPAVRECTRLRFERLAGSQRLMTTLQKSVSASRATRGSNPARVRASKRRRATT